MTVYRSVIPGTAPASDPIAPASILLRHLNTPIGVAIAQANTHLVGLNLKAFRLLLFWRNPILALQWAIHGYTLPKDAISKGGSSKLDNQEKLWFPLLGAPLQTPVSPSPRAVKHGTEGMKETDGKQRTPRSC